MFLHNWRSRRHKTIPADPNPAHPGIELRISNLSGELVRADSDHLFYSALAAGRMHDWLELIPGLEMPYQFGADEPRSCHLRIEIKPVILPGE
jgi:hypothetical protein